MFKYSLYACFTGFLLDLLFGDPNFKFHPVRLIGNLINAVESVLRRLFGKREKAAGFVLVIIVCAVTTGITAFIICFAYRVNTYFGFVIESIICWLFLAAKSLKKESMSVYEQLEKGDVEGARAAVSMIVGRDTAVLDEKGIIKAAVETVAENLSDGVIAPLLYMLIGGGTLGAFYKAVNTMDSMVGYKNDRYINFGFAAAKLDDIMNFIPSRISAVIMIIAAFILKMNYKNAVKIFLRDRLNHSSPNSAQTEAACAGALGIKLAGDAYYFGKLYKKPFIGDEIRQISKENIAEANLLMYTSAVLTMIIFGIIRLFVGGVLL